MSEVIIKVACYLRYEGHQSLYDLTTPHSEREEYLFRRDGSISLLRILYLVLLIQILSKEQ